MSHVTRTCHDTAMSYAAAQTIIDDKNDETPLATDLRLMLSITKKLRTKRTNRVCMYTYMHTCTHTNIYKLPLATDLRLMLSITQKLRTKHTNRVCMHIYMHTCMHINTYAYTFVHVYTYTCVCIKMKRQWQKACESCFVSPKTPHLMHDPCMYVRTHP